MFRISLLSFILLLTLPSFAQFNTIEPCRPVIRIENEPIDLPREDSSSSLPIKDSVVVENARERGSISIRRDLISRYLTVCLPLEAIHVTSPYGKRVDPLCPNKKSFHKGLDLRASENTKVYAMLAGEVVKVGYEKKAGAYVMLRHGDCIVSYCHLSSVLVQMGQAVMPGDVVALSGNTGTRSTGPHLHIRTRIGKKDFDPSVLIDFVSQTKEDCIRMLNELSD